MCSALQSPVNPPGRNKVQQVLPALADFAEFVLDLSSLAVLAGPGQALTHHLQLRLVLLSYTDLLLVVLVRKKKQKQNNNKYDVDCLPFSTLFMYFHEDCSL